ncbi:MAG TPA: molybdopterin-dependent oxidoreductase [Microvirga sp.]|nr:molybdopterin-dependent oxidoreductase [Microvirga sp.]
MSFVHIGRRFAATLLAIAGLVVATAATAQTAGPSTGDPILTISGKIGAAGEGTAQFDRASLEALGTVAVETKTPWHNGTVRFEGVPLAKLMAHVQANGQRVVAMALNDYTTEIPVEDFTKYNVILALKRDGEYMPVRDKGPLFIVYPYDSDPELRSQKYYSRSAWQVARLIVK